MIHTLLLLCKSIMMTNNNHEELNENQTQVSAKKCLEQKLIKERNEKNYEHALEKVKKNLALSSISYRVFALNDENETIAGLIEAYYCMIKKAHVKLFELSFVIYVFTGTSLIYIDGSDPKAKVINKTELKDENEKLYFCMQMSVERQENIKEITMQNVSEHGNFKRSYTIMHGTEMQKSTISTGAALLIPPHPCLASLNQDILLFKIDQFSDGQTGYYKSEFFYLIVTDNTNQTDAIVADNSTSAKSLKNFRQNFQNFGAHYNDYNTVEEASQYLKGIRNYAQIIPVILWILETPFIKSFDYVLSEKVLKTEKISELKRIYEKEFLLSLITTEQAFTKEINIIVNSFELILEELKKKRDDLINTSGKTNKEALSDEENQLLSNVITLRNEHYLQEQFNKPEDNFSLFYKVIVNLEDSMSKSNKAAAQKVKMIILKSFKTHNKNLIDSYVFVSDPLKLKSKEVFKLLGVEDEDLTMQTSELSLDEALDEKELNQTMRVLNDIAYKCQILSKCQDIRDEYTTTLDYYIQDLIECFHTIISLEVKKNDDNRATLNIRYCVGLMLSLINNFQCFHNKSGIPIQECDKFITENEGDLHIETMKSLGYDCLKSTQKCAYTSLKKELREYMINILGFYIADNWLEWHETFENRNKPEYLDNSCSLRFTEGQEDCGK